MTKEVSGQLIHGWQPQTDERHRRWLLARHPVGEPALEDFLLVEDVVPAPAPGTLLVRILYLSVGPFHRLVMNATPRNVQVVPLYGTMIGDAVGEVVKSHHPDFPEGAVVNGILGWQNYALSDGKGHYIHNREGLRIVDESLGPLHTAASVLGRPGLTAYFSVMRECLPRPGDVMLVSSAAGAVGHIAGQIGKILGAHVVGLTSTDAKCRALVEEFGFDDAINYRTANSLGSAIDRVCPKGIDIFYDNVGGAMLETAQARLNPGGRISHVGATLHYNEVDDEGRPWTWKMDKPMFIVHDHSADYGEGRTELARWIAEGRLVYRDDIAEGLEAAPEAFLGLFRGDNIGKRLVRVAERRLDGSPA